MKRETLRIHDMHCEGCAQRITNALQQLQGVCHANVSFSEKEAHVEYDGASVRHDDLKEVVEKAGYSVVDQPA